MLNKTVPSLALATLAFTQATSASEFLIDKDKHTDVWRAELAEDASSSFYYFGYYFRDDDTAKKVRILWNGGAQNNPTTTDFYFVADSEWTIIHRTYNRDALDKLLYGETPEHLKISSRKLNLSSPKLTNQMIKDLKNLLHATSMRQRPLP